MAPRRSAKKQWLCSKHACKTENKVDPECPILNFTPKLNKNKMNVKFGNHSVQCLVDTGATISAISKHLLSRVAPDVTVKPASLSNIVGVCGEIHQVLGQVELKFECEGLTFKQNFYVFEHLHVSMLVGLDFMTENNMTVRFGKVEIGVPSGETASVSSVNVPVTPVTSDQTSFAYTTKEVIVPPHSEAIVPVRISGFANHSTVLIEPKLNLSDMSLAGGKNLCTIENSKGMYRLMNPTNLPVFLKANQRLAKVSLVDSSTVFDMKEPNEAHVFHLGETSQKPDHEQIVKDLGIDLDHMELTEDQKVRLYQFLGNNRDIFAKDISELGVTNIHTHTIRTGNAPPVSSAPYRQTPKMRAELERQLEEMKRHGIIEESNSVWHSPVVMVKKPNNEWRFCVDYRKLNAVTELMAFPIPHMTEVFDTLAESKAEIFSTLDLRSGFWQVPLDKASKSRSAFITHQGIFEFNRLAFGMVNAPMSFQSLMTKVLKNLNFKIALVYIDDLIIFSKDFDQHLHHLNLVFNNLRAANLKLNPAKCKLATKEVKYLGHIVSKDGLRVNPENTDKISNCQRPTNVKQVRSALGMMGYYRKFVRDYAKIAQPLNELLKKDTKFEWKDAHENAFNELKGRLTKAPILRYPQFDKEFTLSVDSSDYSIGFVLSQEHEGKQHPICFGGRALRDNELKWHITDKEGLALVEGIQHYKHYLANSKFTVFTDNVSVKYLQKLKDSQGRLGRWGILLQGYNFEIKHKSGSQNCTADFLSRQRYSDSTPLDSHDLADHVFSLHSGEYTQTTLVYPGEDDTDVMIAAAAAEQEQNDVDTDRDLFIGLSVYQQDCPDFKYIYQYLAHHQVPDNPQLARTVVAEAYNYEVEDGVLKHFYSKRGKQLPLEERLVKQTAIPRCLRDELLKSYHDCIAGGGHQGFERTYASLRSKYYWPSMYEDIRQYVRTCEVCQQSKRAFNAKPPPLQPQAVDDVFGRWQMDILSGLPTTKDKYKHILVMVDSYSKWVELFPLRTQEATEVASVIFREIISRYGAMRSILSDRARNFMSKLVQALAELFDIKRHFTSPYHPMTNGLTESKNSYILQALRAYCKGQQDDWPELLPGIMMAYRSTPATQSTQFSPFFMLYGREMRLPIDTVLQPKDHLTQDHKVHLSRILQNLEVCRKIAGENIKAAQEKYKYQYDKRSKTPDYRPAQRVWLYCTKVPVGKAPKLHRKWVGPYYITLIGPNHTYRLRNVRTNLEVKSLVNAMRLKPYYDPEDRPTNPPEQLADNEDELDPEELEQPQRQTGSNADNAEIRKQGKKPEGTNGTRNQNTEQNARPEGQNENRNTANGNQGKKQKSMPEGHKEPVSSEQGTRIQKKPTEKVVKKTSTAGNTAVKPRDGSQASGTGNTKRSGKVKETDSADKVRTKTSSADAGHSRIQPKGSKSQTGTHGDSGACRSRPESKVQQHEDQDSNRSAKVSKHGNKQKNKQQSTVKQSAHGSVQSKMSDSNKNDAKQGGQKQKVDQNSKQGKKNVIPSCIDCKAGTCKPISEKDIKAIVASQRSNGALYYKLKWQDNSTDWYFPCKIPGHLIREYHANRTMSGKKRKKPLHDKQHKFFAKTDPQVNLVEHQNSPNSHPVVLAVKILNGRSYYLVKNGNGNPEWQPICMAHEHASDIIAKVRQEREDGLYRLKVKAAQESNQPKKPTHLPHIAVSRYIHEMELHENGHWYCLVSYTKPEIPPQWWILDDLPAGLTEHFIRFLSKEFKTYVETDPYAGC